MRISLVGVTGLGDCGPSPSDAQFQANGKTHADWSAAYYAWVNCVNGAQSPTLSCSAGQHYEGSGPLGPSNPNARCVVDPVVAITAPVYYPGPAVVPPSPVVINNPAPPVIAPSSAAPLPVSSQPTPAPIDLGGSASGTLTASASGVSPLLLIGIAVGAYLILGRHK